MKKLILIQNDFSGSGKSTVVRLLRRYLNQHRVEHQFLVLDEEESSIEADARYLNPSQGGAKSVIAALEDCPLTLVEIATGAAESWEKAYEQHEFYHLLTEMGVETTVVVPLTNDAESFNAVIAAAEIYSDNVQYLIAHNTTSAYDDDDSSWDTSYAARVMDMFEAVELRIPAASIDIENALRMQHTTLASSLLDVGNEDSFGKDYSKWLRRAMGQIETARQYVFGDHFRALADTSKEPAKRGRKTAKAAA